MRGFVTKLHKDKFEELMTVREGDTNVNFFIKEKKDMITNVLVLVKESDNFIMLNLRGKIKFSDLQKLDFDVEGSEHFKKDDQNTTDKSGHIRSLYDLFCRGLFSDNLLQEEPHHCREKTILSEILLPLQEYRGSPNRAPPKCNMPRTK